MSNLEKFTKDLLAFAAENLKTISLKRNEYLTKEGQIERYIYLVQSGALRVILLTEHEEQTIRFGYQGSIINSLSSFFNETPSEFYIQAIRQTKVIAIPKTIFLTFVYPETSVVNNSLEHLQFYNAILENLITQQIEREVDILTHSPIERLKRVQARSPQLFQEIPAKYIAAYLRMTPETLSRIRNS
ncbi:MAG: Crp/Fnr family transcriptional regulator [Saprospiraceae bacterium]